MTNSEIAALAVNELKNRQLDVKGDYIELGELYVEQAFDYMDDNTPDNIRTNIDSTSMAELAAKEYAKAQLQGVSPRGSREFGVAFNEWRKSAMGDKYSGNEFKLNRDHVDY